MCDNASEHDEAQSMAVSSAFDRNGKAGGKKERNGVPIDDARTSVFSIARGRLEKHDRENTQSWAP